MAATPDVQDDVLNLLAAQASLAALWITAVGPTRNLYVGKLKQDAGIPNTCTFVQLITTDIDWDNRGNRRVFNVDVILRGDRNAEHATFAKANLINDAVAEHLHSDGLKHGSYGPWTGPTSGKPYFDLTIGGVELLGFDESTDEVYAVVHLKAHYDG